MRELLFGMLVMASAVIGLYFLRFWRDTKDRLFIFFSLAFWLLGVNWLALTFASQDEPQTALYSLRLVAFGLILAGIWDKNRR